MMLANLVRSSDWRETQRTNAPILVGHVQREGRVLIVDVGVSMSAWEEKDVGIEKTSAYQ